MGRASLHVIGREPAGELADDARIRTDSLYRQHGRAVSRICRALLRDRLEAEDATQDVFLAAQRALLGGVVPREPAAWLATIARHECWARHRARVSAPIALPADPAAPDSSPAPIDSGEIAALWQEIAELPPTQREALLLREIRGLSYGQLARHLALSAPAVRSLLERARRRIRLRLRDVHAGLGSVPWVETLARLFAGGNNPVAPAARAAALGLGAAAITGGAIVTPTILERHVRAPAARSASVRPTDVTLHARAARRTSSDRPSVGLDRHSAHARGERGSSRRNGRAESENEITKAGARDNSGRDGSSGGDNAPAGTLTTSSGSGSSDGRARIVEADTHGGDGAAITPVTETTSGSSTAISVTSSSDDGGESHSGSGSGG